MQCPRHAATGRPHPRDDGMDDDGGGLLTTLLADSPRTDTLPVAFFPAFIAMFVLGVVMEPVRMRIRERSGLRTWFPRQREDLRMMRSAAATSGWPPRLVEGLLLAAFLLCAAVFLRTMLPVFLEDWSSSG